MVEYTPKHYLVTTVCPIIHFAYLYTYSLQLEFWVTGRHHFQKSPTFSDQSKFRQRLQAFSRR